jgi:chromosome segregation ATPase
MSRQLSALKVDILDANAELSKRDTEISTLLGTACVHRADSDRLQEENRSLKAKAEERGVQLHELEIDNLGMKVQLSGSEKSREENAEWFASAKRENAVLRVTVFNHHVESAKLTATHAMTEVARSALELTLNASEAEHAHLRTNLTALLSNLEKAAADVKSLEAQGAELREQRSEALAEGEQLKGEVTRLTMDLSLLQAAKLQSELSDAAMEIRLTHAVAQFKEQLEEGLAEITPRLVDLERSSREIGLLASALSLAGARETKSQQFASQAAEQVSNLVSHLEAQQNRNSEFTVQFFQLKSMIHRLASPQITQSLVAEGTRPLALSNLSGDSIYKESGD